MVRNTAGEWIQLASSDQGATWTLVATIASTFGRGLHVFALPFGGFGMTWIDDVDFDISYTTLPSAYTTVTTTPKIDVFVTAFSVQNHRCFGWADPDGTIWAGWTTREQTHLAFSSDGGLTWSDLDWGLWSPDTDDTHLEALTAAPCQGGLILVHNWVAKVGNEGGSVGAWFTGGWSQFETRQASLPDLGVVPQLQRRISFGDVDDSATVEFAHTWLPLDLPTDYDPNPPGPAAPVYTLAGATAGVLVSPGAMEIATVGSAGRYDRDLSAATVNYLQDSIYCLAEFQVLSGGSGTVTEAGIALRIADGTDDIELRINANATGFRVRDENGAVDKATVTIDMTAGVVIMILFKKGTVDFTEVWYRPRGYKPEWTRIEAGTFVSDTATPNADPIISWGNPVSGTATTRWFQFHAIYNDTSSAQSLHSGTVQPLGLRGRWLSTQGLPVPSLATSSDMARAAVTRGPVSRDEVHTSDPAHDFPIEALFPRTGPSPTQRWRSADASNTRIAIDLERDSRLDGSWAYALALVGTNLDQVELEGWDGAAWVTLGQYVGATGFTGLTYSLTGDVIRPNTATTADAGRFLQANEFRGGYAILDPTGTPKVRRIAYHNAGAWNRTDTVHPHIRLEGIDGTEPAGSTCRLVAPGGVLFVHLAGATGDHYERFSISISAASNPTQDGHYEIGALHFAAVTAIGQQWGRGWSRALLPNVSSRTDTAGTTRRKQEGDNARRWVMSWQDPHDRTLMRAGLDLDYISADAGTVPMAAVGDVALQLEGVLDAAQGGAVPCLGLAFVPASTNTTITDRTLWIYGLLTGTIQANNVLGSEGSSEVFRVESITINELVG